MLAQPPWLCRLCFYLMRYGDGSLKLTQGWQLQALEGLPAERQEAWGKWLDEYRAQLRAEGRSAEERQREQNCANPCYVPRNQVMQEAIREAEAGNFQEVWETPLTPL